jgi:hypothetical protein
MAQDAYPKNKLEHFALFGGINQKSSPYVNNPTEFRDIVNMNFLSPGSLTKRPGSTMYAGATISGALRSGVDFQRLSGASYIVVGANTNLYTFTPPSTITAQVTGLLNNGIFSFVTFVDRLFAANGQDFFKFDGVNNSRFSLPPGATASWGLTAVVGGSMTNGGTGVFVCAYGYMNDRGYVGPVSNGFTIILNGVTFNSIGYVGMTQAFTGYGITAIQLWRTSAGGVDLFGTTFVATNQSSATDTGFPLGSSLAIPHLWFTMAPRFTALYNNQLFLGGFSLYPSRLYWSDIGEPEGIQPQNYAEFRTNDGDRLTGLKVHGGALIVAKQFSCTRLVGDNPDNFTFQEISDQYGCMSHQAMVTFNDVCWWLDQKGICEFNGANIRLVSTEKVEPFFLNMNLGAALDNAYGVHYKQYNEVWFAFPSQGSSLNNMVLAYDYVANAWTRYEGLQPASLFLARGTQPHKTVFYGGYTGALFYVGASFFGDNGQGMTCMAYTRWTAAAGETTENLYRRFWMDVDPVFGLTQTIQVNLFKNYNTQTIQFTGMISQGTFQTRLDFGVSSRSIAAQWFHASASLPLKINAYAFESRYQRSV